ncbi:MAG: undecaprenyl-phosphate glucose phosphotransferase [Alphaproteobacteria bacterium RIFCSPHIGHO2_12_FULL_66_14]|jgi:Undecaprenyl-phosphate glucose phosphotransferase|nr:MAG: undecaprenyl-phosphate glucose phosphotransferase [Alphaproteobacteria bacterium RIFCSPHIGHO2_12_FULL_66_14]
MKSAIRPQVAAVSLTPSLGSRERAVIPANGFDGGTTISEAIVTRLVAAFDGVAILATGAGAMHWDTSSIDWRLEGLVVLLGTVLGINFLHLAGAHRFSQFGHLDGALGRVLLGWLLTLATLFAATFAIEPVTAVDGSWIGLWFAGGVTLLAASRLALHRKMQHWSRDRRLGERIAIVGAGAVAQHLLRSLNGTTGTDLRIVGVYDDEVAGSRRRCMGHTILGGIDDLVRDVRQHGIDTVIVALPMSADHQLVETLNKLSVVPVDVRLCPDSFGLRLGSVSVSHIGGHTFLNAIDRPLRDWKWIAKNIEDRLVAAAILALIAPLLLTIALLIKVDSPGPALFRQKRYGFNNRLIEVWKFRTMYQEMTDASAQQLTRRNDPRITRIGAFLRRTSLDELPQFMNVLRGDMSVVGPRPHATAAKAGALLYQEAVKHYDARHRVKPGITGWAQVNGWRGETDTVDQIRKRVEHDLYYIEHWSIAFDLKIILRTAFGGFAGRNAF